MKKSLFVFVVVSLLLFTACTRNIDPDENIIGLTYYPVRVGDTLLYEVARVNHFELTPDEYLNYQLREIITSSFTDESGNISFVAEKYTKLPTSEDWVQEDNVVIRPSLTQIVRVEDNTPYVKLSFPIAAGRTWDGNAFNTLGSDEYKFQNVNKPFSTSLNTFPATVSVLQANEKNILFKDYRIEVFAKDIGMVYKKNEVYSYINRATDNFGVPNPYYGIDSIIAGTYIEQKLISKTP
jgi:hypothetical protein